MEPHAAASQDVCAGDAAGGVVQCGLNAASSLPRALPFLSKLMELQSKMGQVSTPDLVALQHSAAYMVGNLPAAAGSGDHSSTDRISGHAVLVFTASLLSASTHTKASMEGLWQRILEVGRQLLSASEQASPNGQAMPGIGMAVNKPGLQHVGQLLGDVYMELDEIGVVLSELQSHLDAAMHDFSGQALCGDWGPARAGSGQQSQMQEAYDHLVKSCLTCGLSIDTLLLGLSDLHVHARRLLAEAVVKGGCALSPELAEALNEVSAGPQWKPPDQFRRSTTKFWVRMSDVPRLRIALLRHLPVLVIGREEGALLSRLQGKCDQRSTSDAEAAWRAQLSLQAMSTCATEQAASSLITSVYFDAPKPQGCKQGAKPFRSPNALHLWPFASHEAPQVAIMRSPLPVYHSRLRRDDGSTLVRVRWYGPQPDPATGQVFVERKLHREAWTGDFSLKERARMPLAGLSSYLQGNAPEQGSDCEKKKQGEASRDKGLLNEVQQSLTSLNQMAVLRTSYRRTAFQQSNTNEVRISLDTQVVMSVERPSPSRPWTATMGDGGPHGARDRVELPFAILEIKLQDGDSCPDWVLAARESGMLVEVPKFSKFLHGMALLYPDLVRNTPAWFLPEAVSAPAPAPAPTMSVPSTQASVSTPVSAPSAAPVAAVDPAASITSTNSIRPAPPAAAAAAHAVATGTAQAVTVTERSGDSFSCRSSVSEPISTSTSGTGSGGMNGLTMHSRSISAAHLQAGSPTKTSASWDVASISHLTRSDAPTTANDVSGRDSLDSLPEESEFEQSSASPALEKAPKHPCTASTWPTLPCTPASSTHYEEAGNGVPASCAALGNGHVVVSNYQHAHAFRIGQNVSACDSVSRQTAEASCWGGALQRMPHRPAHSAGSIMTPATIEEMAEACRRDRLQGSNEHGVFPEEITPGQWFDARTSPLLHPKAHLGDPSCPACAAALVMAVQPNDMARCNSSTVDVMHTCNLGKACAMACMWVMPTAPANGSLTGITPLTTATVPSPGYAAACPVMPLADDHAGGQMCPSQLVEQTLNAPAATDMDAVLSTDRRDGYEPANSSQHGNRAHEERLVRVRLVSADDDTALVLLISFGSSEWFGTGSRQLLSCETEPDITLKPSCCPDTACSTPTLKPTTSSSADPFTDPKPNPAAWESSVPRGLMPQSWLESSGCDGLGDGHGCNFQLDGAGAGPASGERSLPQRLGTVMQGWQSRFCHLLGKPSAAPHLHDVDFARRAYVSTGAGEQDLCALSGCWAEAPGLGGASLAAAAVAAPQPTPDQLHTQPAPQTACLRPENLCSSSSWAGASITSALKDSYVPDPPTGSTAANGLASATVLSLDRAAQAQRANTWQASGPGGGEAGSESSSQASSDDRRDNHVAVELLPRQRDDEVRVAYEKLKAAEILGVTPWVDGITSNADKEHAVVKDSKPGSERTEAVGGKRAALGGVRHAGRASWRWLVAQAQRDRRPGAGGGGGDEETGQSANPRAAALVRSRVEPKTFFAAERTLLSWLNLSVLLLFVALSLLANAASFASRTNQPTAPLPATAPLPVTAPGTIPNVSAAAGPPNPGPVGHPSVNGSSLHTLQRPSTQQPGPGMVPGLQTIGFASATLPRGQGGGSGLLVAVCGTSGALCKAGLVCGVAIAPVALLFMLYALFMYRKRTAQILRRDTVRYDDQRGPVVLVLLMVALLVVTLALTISMMRL